MSWSELLNQDTPRGDGFGLGIEVLHWAYARHLLDNVPHRHTFFEVCLVGAYGQGRFTVEGNEYPIGPGDLFFARPGVTHRIQNTAQPRMELFWVSFSLAPRPDETQIAPLARAFSESRVLITPDDGVLSATWHALRLAASQEKSAIPALRHLEAALLLAVLRAGTPPDHHETVETGSHREALSSRDGSTTRLAMRYVRDNLDRRLTVAEVASHVHVSPRQFARLMQTFAGTSPADYIEQAKLDRACFLLRGSALPIKSIARQVGYEDVQHFTRVFSRRVGVPPGAFRRGDDGWAGSNAYDFRPDSKEV